MNEFFEPVDICIFCALAEEIAAVKQVFSEGCRVKFTACLSQRMQEYYHTTIFNKDHEPLSLCLSWPPGYGPEEAGMHVSSFLHEFRPRLAAMVGICAGDKDKVALGDVIVADRAFSYESGKFIEGELSQPTQLPDTSTRHIDSAILQYIRVFDSWKSQLSRLVRPPSRRQQTDWLLLKLLQSPSKRVDDLNQGELGKNAPDWKSIVASLQSSRPRRLNKHRSLRKSKSLRDFPWRPDFPYRDPAEPRRFVAAMASGSAVRSDSPFKRIQHMFVRNALAIDMEGAAFYRAAADFPDVRPLLVKSVADYADADKDDSYHEYAAKASALYLLTFLQQYMLTSRFPQIRSKRSARSSAPPSEAKKCFDKGYDSIEADDFHKGIRAYSKAIRLFPQYDSAYHNRAVAYLKQQKYTKAVSDLTKAIELSPENAGYYNTRGIAHFWNGKYAEAIADYSESIRLGKRIAKHWYDRGEAYRRQGEAALAVGDCTQAIHLKSRYAEPFATRGAAFAMLGEYEYALADLSNAIELNPSYAFAFLQRGLTHARKRQYELAEKDIDRAVCLAPSNAEFWRDQGSYFRHRIPPDYRKAVNAYTHAIEIKCQDAEAYYWRSVCLRHMGKSPEADEDLKMAEKIDPKVKRRN